MHDGERLMSIERGVIKLNISVIEDGEYRKIDYSQRIADFYITETRDLWVWTALLPGLLFVIESGYKPEALYAPTPASNRNNNAFDYTPSTGQITHQDGASRQAQFHKTSKTIPI